MLKIVVLICANTLAAHDCTIDTAASVMRPQRVMTEQQCMFLGMATVAPTQMVPDPEHQYMKIACVRDRARHMEWAENGAISNR